MRKMLSSILFLSLFGCSDFFLPYEPVEGEPHSWELELTVELDPRLDLDNNGYYHLDINQDSWQTLHRVSGSITQDGYGVENFRIGWESNLYWYLGDTLGYVVKRGLNWNLQYVSYDTVYITGFTGHEVPTSNQVSLSNSSGEFNNMIAPVKTMEGDTMKLTADWYDGSLDFYIVLD